MPLNISKTGKILKALNRLETITEFNTSLPVKIEVKKQINPIRYLIQLGNREVETKSTIALTPGNKYFAEIKDIKNKLQISNLKEIPEILDMLDNISLKNDKNKTFKLNTFSKHEILHHLSNANSKTEFLFFTNILMALEQKIHHLIINGQKKAMIQYKYTKNRVKFYAIFNHLGELEGEISTDSLSIYSPYLATLNLIEYYKNDLNLKLYLYKKDIKPLFAFSQNLLNLKV